MGGLFRIVVASGARRGRQALWLRAVTLAICLLCAAPRGVAQGSSDTPPVRYQAQYTQIYLDAIESVGPVLSPAFSFDTGGSITTNPAEVIDGQRSIKGIGSGSFTNFFRTNTPQLSFSPGRAYRVTFRYRILAALQDGMASFYSNAASAAHAPSAGGAAIKGNTGDSGTITMNGTLGPYNDYQVYWSIGSSGAVVIDDIQISEAATGNVAASENAEGIGPGPGSGLVLDGGGTVTTDASLVIGGKASVHLTSGGGIVTDPKAIPLAGNGTYVFEFDYRVLLPGNPETLYMSFQPAGVQYNPALVVNAYDPLLKNAPAVGRFAVGAQLGGASSYVFNIGAPPGTDIIIDNVAVYRLDAVPSTTPPPAWARLSTLPYPRLGKEVQVPPGRMAYTTEGNPLLYSWDTITRRLGLMDLITGLDMVTQTQFAGSLYRIRELNPSLVILPIEGPEGIVPGQPAPTGSNRDPGYDRVQGMAPNWLVKDSKGNPVPDLDYPGILFGNISLYCPVVGGKTFADYELSWLDKPVSTAVWDGFRFDNFFASIDFHIPNANDPALLDVDLKGDGVRETPAMVSDLYRKGAIDLAQRFGAKYGDSQLAIANQGDYPDPSLAPYLNGNLFECFNLLWNNQSSIGWRMGLDMYRTIEATARLPHVNMIEGCGKQGNSGQGGTFYTTPTADDIQQERFTLATALLGGAAYGYDLHGNLSAPLWYDEYAVDANGVAVEDAKGKGYLGQALADGTELASPATLVWAEDFESGVLPPAFLGKPSGAVSVTQAPGEVIAGAGSLVVSNPDHTKRAFVDAETDPAAVRLTPGKSYLLTFDWRILETLDFPMEVSVFQYPVSKLDNYSPPTAIVAGDSGTAHIPFIVPQNSVPTTIRFAVQLGGGKVAFDNILLYEGGIGPWRRDFENGFVLLNPLKQARTFPADEIAGSLQRTGVRRILGTAAPDVNNGQTVSDRLTLAPFDAIVLLADHIDAAPVPTSAKPLHQVEWRD